MSEKKNENVRIKFLNTYIDNVTMDEAVDRIDKLVQARKPSYVVTPNVDHIVKIENDKEFAQIYEEADLIVADGMPLLWMAKRMGTPLKEKVSGSDLFPRVCEMAAKKGYKMYFLGAAEGVAAKAAENLKAKYPGLQVVGTYSPSYGFEQKEDEMKEIERMLKEAAPDILIVCLGCPKQEKFAYKYGRNYGIPVSLGLGASIDFEAGKEKRCPAWMARCGLEWIYRLMKEPKRMYKRYLVDDRKIFGIYKKYK